MKIISKFLSILLCFIFLSGCTKNKVETFHEKEWQISCVNSVKVFTKKCEREEIGEFVDDENLIVFFVTLIVDLIVVHSNNKKIKKQCEESKEPDALVECLEYDIRSRENQTDSSVIMSFSEQDWKIKCLDKEAVICNHFSLIKRNKGQKYKND